MDTRDRAKTRHRSVETEPRPKHEKPCLRESLKTRHDSRLHHWLNSLVQSTEVKPISSLLFISKLATKGTKASCNVHTYIMGDFKFC